MSSDGKKLYEAEIKDLILNKQHIFINKNDNHVVLFEKAIVVGSTITDCLIFSEEQGIIGIEIKTEYDSTRRLNKQLENYSRVCDKVYILCHDNHVDTVEDILKRHKYNHVGILSYTEFREEAVLGIYREPLNSPNKCVEDAYNILWKEEISNILGSFKRQVSTLEEKGYKVNTSKSTGDGVNGLYSRSNASKKYLRKNDMVKMIVNRLGYTKANQLICDIFIKGRMHPEKPLSFYYFRSK